MHKGKDVTYVVAGRKADKYEMVSAVRKEIDAVQDRINHLEDVMSSLWNFRNTLAGKDGVEAAGRLYQEDTEAAYGVILPHSVARIYNSNLR